MASHFSIDGILSEIGQLTKARCILGDLYTQDVLALLYPIGIPMHKIDSVHSVAEIVSLLFRVTDTRLENVHCEDLWVAIAGVAALAIGRNRLRMDREALARSKAEAVAEPELSASDCTVVSTCSEVPFSDDGEV